MLVSLFNRFKHITISVGIGIDSVYKYNERQKNQYFAKYFAQFNA